MDPDFWLDRWQQRQTAFHEAEGNPLLGAHLPRLGLGASDRVFVPLCGKTGDIARLLDGGFRVAGAELSELAVSELFADLGVTPAIDTVPKTRLRHFHADGLDIWCGDVFELDADTLGPVDAVYDRAAMVALPDGLRDRYTSHLRTITRSAPMLLITFLYDQSAMDGPPFSIDRSEIDRHYADGYTVRPVAALRVEGDLKGQVPATEAAWLLEPIGGGVDPAT